MAGLAGGIIDSFMMRVVDTFLAVPAIVLPLILVSILTPNLFMIIILLSRRAGRAPAAPIAFPG